jgi:hypothetical protein
MSLEAVSLSWQNCSIANTASSSGRQAPGVFRTGPAIQTTVLVFQTPQPLGFANLNPAVLTFQPYSVASLTHARGTDAHLPARLVLFQKRRDLLFGKSPRFMNAVLHRLNRLDARPPITG